MISSIEGELASVTDGRAELDCGRVSYMIFVPAHDEQWLAQQVGSAVRFQTLHYLETQGQGASYIPRLIGFRTAQDRSFFELFTTVKGLGNRKALRALQLSFGDVARAIAEGDLDLLTSLPEIGKRTAQSIVAELSGKVDRFLEFKPIADDGGGDPTRHQMVQDAVTILVQLGESRVAARQMIDRALRTEPELGSADELVAAAFRVKAST